LPVKETGANIVQRATALSDAPATTIDYARLRHELCIIA
jgi:hypothetical protein